MTIKPLFVLRLESEEMYANVLGVDEDGHLYSGTAITEADDTRIVWREFEEEVQ